MLRAKLRPGIDDILRASCVIIDSLLKANYCVLNLLVNVCVHALVVLCDFNFACVG